MAMTVTATQGGTTGASLALRVFVLTGAQASAAQTGGSANAQIASSTAFTASITTTAGSNVYGAFSHGSGVTDSGSNTTVVDDIDDGGTNGWLYGTFKALNVTSGATTRGVTASSAQSGPLAMLEILASGTLAEDSSAPAVASGAGTSNTAVTTASFTPPGGSLLVAVVGSNGGATVTTMTVSGGGLTWSEKVKNNPSGGDYAGVWIADAPAPAGGIAAARPGRTWLRRFHHPQSPPVASLVTAAAAPFAAELLQPPFPQRPAAHRARMGALGACAAGILAVTTLSPQPAAVPPSRPAPVVNRHLPPHRAVWHALAGPAPPAVQAAPAAPARPRPPTSRPTPPHRAIARWLAAKTTLSPQPAAVPPARPRPPAYRPPGPHRAVWDMVAGAQPAAQPTEQVVTLLPVTAVSPRAPHRATGKGILAKTALSPQPPRVPPPQWRQPNAPRPAHRALWRAVAGPPPPVVVVTAVPPARPAPTINRPPAPHRAIARWLAAKTTLSAQPASVPAPHWVPQPRYRPPHRAIWDAIAGLPPVPGKSAPARPRPPAYRPPGPHRGTWRLQAGPQPPPPPPFTIGLLTAADTSLGVLTGLTAGGGSGGVLTASDTRTGGPGG